MSQFLSRFVSKFQAKKQSTFNTSFVADTQVSSGVSGDKLLQEDGSSFFLLEDGVDKILLQ